MYRHTLLLILGALLLALPAACRTPDASESAAVDEATDADDTKSKDAETRNDDASEDAKARQNANDDASRPASSAGPRKIKRPNASSKRTAAPTQDDDAASKSAADTPPSEAEEIAESHAPSAPVQEDDAGEESARQFAFEGSDEELEMILGMKDIPPFYIDDLLSEEDLRKALGPHTPTEIHPLPGQEPSPYYNHRWFRSTQDDRMGVVFQYWHFQTAAAATTQYELMERNAAHETRPVGVGSQAHYMEQGDTTTLVALLLELRAVVSFTCDVENCHVPAIMRWVKNIQERAGK